MPLPFTVEQFLDVFRRYNEQVWPAQLALLLLGVGAVVLAARARPGARARPRASSPRSGCGWAPCTTWRSSAR
jgi:hypothetical protein